MIRAEDLKKYFPIERGFFRRKAGEVKAVDGIYLKIEKGKTLGLVGESGCGKTTVGRLFLDLLKPDSGRIIKAKGVRSQIVFQDPFGSLNPRMKTKHIVTEGLVVEKETAGLNARAGELMDVVGLPRQALQKYPHQFSGGERQRICIARAIATNPDFIVCDEPVSSLDVSIRMQILKLLKELQEKFGLSYLFIAHDLGVVQHMSHTVAVMYLGKIVEVGSGDNLYRHPLHPYTRILLSSSPTPYLARKEKRIIMKGDLPSPSNPPSGCRFHTRCPYSFKKCSKDDPSLTERQKDHFCACHLAL